jgi:hypothetical protein
LSTWPPSRGLKDKVAPQTAVLFNGPGDVELRLYTTLNVYARVLDGSACAAADRVGSELLTRMSTRMSDSE